ncbi:hypothetical protein [Enterobacter sp.]|uniref:cold shock small protein YmcF n=1 Tax=Enterobacter sp. TaxID=42895 RepID=UPI00296F3E14|nr:hypothetical protein [Enterobacter sp.]
MSTKMTGSVKWFYPEKSAVSSIVQDNPVSMHFTCPRCHGSQYRTSHFDVTESNPFGAKCIFCKSVMVARMHGYTGVASTDKNSVGLR